MNIDYSQMPIDKLLTLLEVGISKREQIERQRIENEGDIQKIRAELLHRTTPDED
jgi:hypothetical protein